MIDRLDLPVSDLARRKRHPHYDGAFALDPDGHDLEAVCQQA